MKNKGFTLMELLAVLIILAIIALIAVPIVINIIQDTKEESELRSAELYIDAVDKSILAYNMSNKFKEGTCIVQSTGNLDCDGTIIAVDVKNTKATAGTIVVENRRVKTVTGLAIGENTYSTDTNGKLIVQSETPQVPTQRYYYWGYDSYDLSVLPDEADTNKSNVVPDNELVYIVLDSTDGETIDAAYVCILLDKEYCLKGADLDAYLDNVDILDEVAPNSCNFWDNTHKQYECNKDGIAPGVNFHAFATSAGEVGIDASNGHYSFQLNFSGFEMVFEGS